MASAAAPAKPQASAKPQTRPQPPKASAAPVEDKDKDKGLYPLPAIDMTVDEPRLAVVMQADDLRKMRERGFIFKASKYDWRTHAGVQRNGTEQRFEEIADYVGGGNPIDNSLLLNVAPPDKIEFRAVQGKMGFVYLDPAVPIEMPDGNHRFTGSFMALENDDELQFSLLCILTNRNNTRNLQQFVVQNGTPKLVPNNLLVFQKAELLKNLTDDQIKHLPARIRSNSKKLVPACEVVTLLHTNNAGDLADNPFFGRIAMPNDKTPENSLVSANVLVEYARKALVNKQGVWVATVQAVATNFARFFRAWEVRCAESLVKKECKLFAPHSGSEMLLYCLARLMSQRQEVANRVPTVEEWDALLDFGAHYTKAQYWNPENQAGVGSLHGRAAGQKLGAKIAEEINRAKIKAECPCEGQVTVQEDGQDGEGGEGGEGAQDSEGGEGGEA